MQKTNTIFILLALFGLTLLIGCTDENGMTTPSPTKPRGAAYRILVGNEGGFTYGNASLSVIDPTTGGVSEQIIQAANGRPLGDVLQSMTLLDGRLYLALNNSGRVEVIDTSDYGIIGSITGLTSPRYVQQAGANKLYVSDFQADALSVVDAARLEVTGTIPLAGWTEEMLLVDTEMWVTNRYSDYVYVVDTATDTVRDSIEVAYGSGAIGRDAAGKVWVYCAGDLTGERDGGLYRINPAAQAVEQSFPLSSDLGLYPRLAFDAEGDTLFYLQDGLRVLPVGATQLPVEPLIPATGHNWYGVGYDAVADQLWLCDARDFQRRGEVVQYDRLGNMLGRYEAGVIPALVLVTGQ